MTPGHDIERLHRIRYVTQHFQELQGYRLLPFVAFYLVGAVYDATYSLLTARAPAPLVVTTAILMVLSFVSCAVASHHIGQLYTKRYGLVRAHGIRGKSAPSTAKPWWWTAIGPWVWADDSSRRAASFSAENWWLLALIGVTPVLGFHAPLLALLGGYLVWRQLTQRPTPFRHVPNAVLYLALAVNFPGIDTGILGGPGTTGFNPYVLKDLVLAILLGAVALTNHRTLTHAFTTEKSDARGKLHD